MTRSLARVLAIPASRGQGYASVVHTLITHARRGVVRPGAEIAKDKWDLALFGHRGNLSFTAITQPWLRETAKLWALPICPAPPRPQRRRTRPRHHRQRWRGCRRACGCAPTAASTRRRWDARDIEVFLHRLAYLASAGQISALTRGPACREVRKC